MEIKTFVQGRQTNLTTKHSLEYPYLFHVFVHHPTSISCQIEKIMRDFLWSNNEAEMGFHWVKWEDVYHPKREGGLGIRSLRDMNKALKSQVALEICQGR